MHKITTKIVLIFLLSVQYSIADTLEKFVGKSWQPEAASFGRIPWDFCALTISNSNLLFSDKHSASFPYKVVTNTNNYAVLEVNAGTTNCFNPKTKGKTYWRVDTASYFMCRVRNSKPCPRSFRGGRVFEVSVFKALSEANNYSSEPIGYHGYYPYKK